MASGRGSPLLGWVLAHAMGGATVHLLRLHVGGGRVIIIVRGGAALRCKVMVREVAEEALLPFA